MTGPVQAPLRGRALDAQVVVLAKRPVPGRVKTRLCPPFTPRQAALLAAAALDDTLAAVRATPVRRRVLALDAPFAVRDDGFDVLAQRGGGLDERIANAMGDSWRTLPRPVLLVGMDTPQVTPGLLTETVRRLLDPGGDAVLGLADDGGFWALGLRRPRPAHVLGVAMSRSDTGARQRDRLREHQLTVVPLPGLRDVDTVADAVAVSAAAPHTRFAATLRWMHDGEGAA